MVIGIWRSLTAVGMIPPTLYHGCTKICHALHQIADLYESGGAAEQECVDEESTYECEYNCCVVGTFACASADEAVC